VRAHAELRAQIDEAVARVITRGRFVLGEELEAFESEFASYVGSRHCVGVANGTEALVLALGAAGVAAGDEVVVPTNTCSPTWLAVSALGAVPVGVEPDPDTYTMDPSRLRAALGARTAAVVPVHLYGLAADMDAIRAAVEDSASGSGTPRLVEDAAQAHGTRYRSRRAGSLGDAAAWSFYPTKNLGALGDGGAVTTDDEDLARRVRSLRNYGWGEADPYVSRTRGMNSRLDEIQAAILRVKLGRLEEWNARRAAIADAYISRISNPALRLPREPAWARSSWHLFVLRSPWRDQLREHMDRLGVATLVHYPVPPADQPAYADDSPSEGSELARQLGSEVLSVPLHPHLSAAEVDQGVDALNSFEPVRGDR
jgi:dTDP-4-amino-4,6-dideoxygalactose transaminase